MVCWGEHKVVLDESVFRAYSGGAVWGLNFPSVTVYMNPFSRFIYWNMNYHVEHHMFPQVPMHAFPALHQQMLPESPKPYPNQWVALKEVVHAVWRQRSAPDYSVWRTLPTAASAEPRPAEARADLKSAA